MQIRNNTTIISVWGDGTIEGACRKYLKLMDNGSVYNDRISLKRIGKDGSEEIITGMVNQVWWDYDTPHGHTMMIAIGGEYDKDGINYPWKTD